MLRPCAWSRAVVGFGIAVVRGEDVEVVEVGGVHVGPAAEPTLPGEGMALAPQRALNCPAFDDQTIIC